MGTGQTYSTIVDEALESVKKVLKSHFLWGRTYLVRKIY